MPDPLSPAERAFRELFLDQDRYAQWAEQCRHDWALRGLERTRPRAEATNGLGREPASTPPADLGGALSKAGP